MWRVSSDPLSPPRAPSVENPASDRQPQCFASPHPPDASHPVHSSSPPRLHHRSYTLSQFFQTLRSHPPVQSSDQYQSRQSPTPGRTCPTPASTSPSSSSATAHDLP